MALTYTTTRKGVEGDTRYWFGTITFDTSYATGGLAVNAASLGMVTVQHANVSSNTANSRLATWDGTNKKVLLYTALGTEAANASNQSTITVPAHFIGY